MMGSSTWEVVVVVVRVTMMVNEGHFMMDGRRRECWEKV